MKILVVDDDLRIVKTTCDILKIRGYQPLAAYSGEEGVEIVKNDPPSCVLVSAYATDALAEGAIRAGAYTCLYKPFETDALFQIIEEIRFKKLKNALGEGS